MSKTFFENENRNKGEPPKHGDEIRFFRPERIAPFLLVYTFFFLLKE